MLLCLSVFAVWNFGAQFWFPPPPGFFSLFLQPYFRLGAVFFPPPPASGGTDSAARTLDSVSVVAVHIFFSLKRLSN